MSDTLGNVRLGRYGFDGDFRVVPAPVVGVVVVAGWLGLAAGTVAAALAGRAVLASFLGVAALGVLAVTAVATHTTKRGKFQVWDELLRDLRLTGEERLVDLGCGRGAVLMAAAKRLPNGRAEGVDIWAADQTGNGADAAYRNAEREGVRDRVVLHTADITSLPFEDASVDVVVSSVAVHNIDTPAGRAAAIDEAARILRPGGQLHIADIRFTAEYVTRLRENGFGEMQHRNLGWRFWWGGPWLATHLVSTRKP